MGFRESIRLLLALFVVTAAVLGFIWFVIPDLWNQSVKASDTVLQAFTEKNALQLRSKIHEFSPLIDRILGYRVYQFVRSPNSVIMKLPNHGSPARSRNF